MNPENIKEAAAQIRQAANTLSEATTAVDDVDLRMSLSRASLAAMNIAHDVLDALDVWRGNQLAEPKVLKPNDQVVYLNPDGSDSDHAGGVLSVESGGEYVRVWFHGDPWREPTRVLATNLRKVSDDA
jgi:hypothetical protein